MGEDENITSFILKVTKLVCGIRCVSGVLEETKFVFKVIRSLLPSYKHKASTIDEIWTITNVTRDMLIGKLTAFELSEFGDSLPKTKSAFKTAVSGKQRYDLGEISARVCICEN